MSAAAAPAPDAAPSSRPAAAPNLGLSLDDHVDLDTLDVRQFVLHPPAQALLCAMQHALLEAPYIDFGRCDADSTRFNIVFPSTFGSDRRKPVTAEFQQFCETVYWPLVSVFLFGRAGWSSLRRHLTSFKVNTLRISEDEFYYGLPIYHFHLDHKIGQPAPKDECQLNTCRMIFSIVPAALEAGAAPEHDSTVYLRRQPPHGFTKQEALHTYLKTRYPEVGLARGRQRPLYEVSDDELYRAPPGEVLLHHSHPGRPVHAETNPCPEGRGLFVLDWTDLRNAAPDGARRPATRMPMGEILTQLRVLAADPAGEAYRARLGETLECGAELLAVAEPYPGGRQALEAVLRR